MSASIKEVLLASHRRGERGGTVAEYAMMISGIAIAVVAATFALGDDLLGSWNQLSAFIRSL